MHMYVYNIFWWEWGDRYTYVPQGPRVAVLGSFSTVSREPPGGSSSSMPYHRPAVVGKLTQLVPNNVQSVVEIRGCGHGVGGPLWSAMTGAAMWMGHSTPGPCMTVVPSP